VASPRLSIWVWAALGLGGLAIAGAGALLYLSAWDSYVSANPRYIYDAVHPSPATDAIGTQAFQATILLTFGFVMVLIALFTRLRRTNGGWMLVRALGALAPVLIYWMWLKRFFPIWASNLCGDCTPVETAQVPSPFALGSDVMAVAAVLGVILFVVFFAIAIVDLARLRRRPITVARS
jgi:hypothetical protein